jgi:uncharacterized RDD family membrane protein YckC
MSREISILTPEQVELQFELAGIGSRFIALLIDQLWQSLIILAIVLSFIAYPEAIDAIGSSVVLSVVIVVVGLFFITNGYFIYFEATRNGQTPGKKAVNIRVIRDSGHPVDFRAVLIRNLMRTVDCLPGLYAVGIISAFISPQYRRLGDFVAGTLVVKAGRYEEQKQAASAVESPSTTVLTETPVQPESKLPFEILASISNLSKDDYRAIRYFLDRMADLEAAVTQPLSQKMIERISPKLGIDPLQVQDQIAFLQEINAEWERRNIH